MKRLSFNITISAPKEKVWSTLWEDETYQQWTSAFSEGSYALSDWKEGSQIWFLDYKKNGMFSIITKLVPEKRMVFTHQGIVIDGIKQIGTQESNQWKGAKEEYSLKETSGITELSLEIDVTEKHLDYFNESIPIGLNNVKKLSEAHQ